MAPKMTTRQKVRAPHRPNTDKAYPLQKSITLYKIGEKVTIRKPRAREAHIQFRVEPTPGMTLTKVKQFVKYVVTDVKELNFLKNDMGFLLAEIYGKDHSVDLSIDVSEGTIFYIWAYLPFKDPDSQMPPNDIQKQVFPFDVFYIRERLSEADCKSIQTILKRDIETQVHVRSVGELPKIPFVIRVTNVEETRGH